MPRKLWGVAGRQDGVEGNFQPPVGAVFEAHGHGEAAGHFPVGLAFDGSGADGRPAHQVCGVLRGHRIQHLGGTGQAQLVDLQQDGAGQLQAGGNVAGAIQVGIVDQPLPAHGGARLLKIGAHHDHQVLAGSVGHPLEAVGVLQGRFRIVDGAGADDHHQAMEIPSVDDVANGLPRGEHHLGCRFRQRQLGLDSSRGNQGSHLLDVAVVGLGGGIELSFIVSKGWASEGLSCRAIKKALALGSGLQD